MITQKQGKANCYIINFNSTVDKQLEALRKFCGNNIEIGKIYVTPTGDNTDKYYELIKDIINKKMDILFMNIYTIFAMNEREKGMIVHLCRKSKIIYVEI